MVKSLIATLSALCCALLAGVITMSVYAFDIRAASNQNQLNELTRNVQQLNNSLRIVQIQNQRQDDYIRAIIAQIARGK